MPYIIPRSGDTNVRVCRGLDFRKQYSKINTLRPYFPNILFLTFTATATTTKLAQIKDALCFRAGCSITIRETVNRKNLFYGVKEISGQGDEQQDLDFLIPIWGIAIDTIALTIIYCDKIEECLQVAKYLRRRLDRSYRRRPRIDNPLLTATTDVRSVAEKTIAVYFSDLSDRLKDYIQRDWRNGTTRILVSTSAWGMGIDDAHVLRVIQWKVSRLNCLDTLV